MTKRLEGKQVVILLAEGFEDLEFNVPVMRLQEEGADVTIAASSSMRRSGCSVISTTCSGCRQVSRMSRSPRSSRYSGR